ncbi:GLPGLI family protein [Flavobacterium frigidarium]|uniref:GLPGLI family protein n=1 Tax=Flavobacterium frigidarium TaxID=99286 RepID=UPI00047A97C2|nr:GLPGLI family protein [Flavobacterium frigidarium]
MKFYLVFVCLTLSGVSFAQKSVKISYEQRILYSDVFFNQVPENEREELKRILSLPNYFELTNNGDFSLFKSVNSKEEFIASKKVNTTTSIHNGSVIKPFKMWILKNHIKRSNLEDLQIMDMHYYYESPFTDIDLIYDNKIKKIDNYSCKSAYSISPSKDTIRYWYTQEIPILDGPYTMTTIPGLILSVEEKRKVIYITKIEFFDKKIIFEDLDKKILFVTADELKKIKEEMLKPKSYTDENGAKHTTETKYIKP